ncbi:hypothetical protein [Streptomyces sp. NPDC096012]|uniref:hypothetical protein n=1 Tax=Streptomyces sp. NPDC096012 TaxID=3155684 RepID=UPI00336A9FCD
MELLEQGRSVLWRSTMHLRGDLTLLTEKESALAEGLERIRTQLHATAQVDPDLRVVLARRWSKLPERVRSKTGFRTFLKPPVRRPRSGGRGRTRGDPEHQYDPLRGARRTAGRAGGEW